MKYVLFFLGAINTIPNIETIWLDANRISYIEELALYIPQLRRINLNNNYLASWNQNWLGRLNNLEEINFAYNHLKIISRRAFSNFPNLKNMYLNNNNITNIEPEAFEPLNTLSWLDLRNNQIALLNANSFTTPIRIDYLFLDFNHLNFLPRALLTKLHSDFLSLNFNPWSCSCISVINEWVSVNSVNLIRNDCTPSGIPLCIAFKSQCTEKVYRKGTRKYLRNLKTFSPDQFYCLDQITTRD